MRRISRHIVASLVVGAIVVLCGTASVHAQDVSGSKETLTDSEIREILHKMDELYRAESSYSELEMEIITPHWQRTLAMHAWTKAMDRTFIRITEPRKEKGVATLRIDNEMWNFLPKTNKVIKVPPSMMMSSWMGSDFTNDDLVDEFTMIDDYTYRETTVSEPEEGLVYIKCVPREDLPVVWGHVVIAVERETYLPEWYKYYDEKGELMRTLAFSEVKVFDRRPVPTVMAMTPARKKNQQTVIRYRTLQFDVDVGDDIFSLRNLRAQR